MTTLSMSMTGERAAPALERVAFGLLLGLVGATQISIAAANIFLAAMLACWVAILVRDRTWPAAPAFFLPLAVYAGITIVSAIFSVDPRTSLVDCKQLVLFSIVPAVYHIARGERAQSVVDVIVSVGGAIAAVGIIQYGMLHYDHLGQRPQGTLTHYMTYSGVLMLVICTAAARIIFGGKGRTWPALVMPALVVALALTFTRNGLVGVGVAVGLLFVLKDFRLTALLPVFIAIAFAVAPDRITDRVMSIFNLQDPTIADRFAMMETGAGMIADDPLTGVGPDMVSRVYAQYRSARAVNATNPHLHNVPLQIAAERGLPALAAWLYFVAALGTALYRLFRGGDNRALAASALAALASMLAAGLFEYNFGDSEFLMLFLVLVTLPFAARRDVPAAAAARS